MRIRLPPGAGRSSFWPFEGGVDELPGVFGGWVNVATCASNATIHCSAGRKTCHQRQDQRGLNLLRSGGGVTPAFRIQPPITMSRTIRQAGPEPAIHPAASPSDPGRMDSTQGDQSDSKRNAAPLNPLNSHALLKLSRTNNSVSTCSRPGMLALKHGAIKPTTSFIVMA